METNNLFFNEQQQRLLNDLLESLNPQQSLWLGGYLTGILQVKGLSDPAVEAAKTTASTAGEKITSQAKETLHILFGSRTGNAKALAHEINQEARQKGIATVLSDMQDYNPRNLKKEKYLLLVVSTDGQGEPPLAASDLHAFLHSAKASKLPHLQFAVVGLGDSSYKQFCQTGKDFDAQLEKLEAKRLLERADCDLDFAETAPKWYHAALDRFLEKIGHTEEVLKTNKPSATPRYSAKNPYQAKVLELQQLNGRHSQKETWHVELSIEDSGITYEPGDALHLVVPNRNDLVEQILEQAAIRPDSPVLVNKAEKSIREALLHDFEITVLTRPVLERYNSFLLHKNLEKVLSDENDLQDFLYGRDLLDLLQEFPTVLSAGELASVLRSLQARPYSIASSFQANPDELHLTIAAVRYQRNNRRYNGLASTHLPDQLFHAEELPVYVQTNPSFRLPADTKAPIIMIGPGTGVAPFRAFLQERALTGNPGKSWLFFGDQHFATDFLYQTEMQKYLKTGILSQMDVAFSRDQDHKIYVQHRLEEKSKELFQWIQDGAYIYLCGDQQKMAKDVKHTLVQIFNKQGQMKQEAAENYLLKLRKSGRFQEDIY